MGKRPPPKGSFSKRGGAQPNFWQCCCSRAFGSFRAGPSSGLPDMHKYSESDTRPSCRTTPGGPLAYQGWPWFRLPWCVHTYTVRHKCRTTAVGPLATAGMALAMHTQSDGVGPLAASGLAQAFPPQACTHSQTKKGCWQLQGWPCLSLSCEALCYMQGSVARSTKCATLLLVVLYLLALTM